MERSWTVITEVWLGMGGRPRIGKKGGEEQSMEDVRTGRILEDSGHFELPEGGKG